MSGPHIARQHTLCQHWASHSTGVGQYRRVARRERKKERNTDIQTAERTEGQRERERERERERGRERETGELSKLFDVACQLS
eukprot:1779224-Rhodomonas_salina.2